MSPAEADRIRQAQAALDEVRVLMLAPSVEGVEGSVAHLERAVACVAAVRDRFGAGMADAAPGAGLLKLRKSVERVSRLIENAAVFHLGWAQQFAVATGGYTASGEPTRPGGGSLLVEG